MMHINQSILLFAQVFWQVSRGLAKTHAYISIDDIKWSAGACPTEGAPEEPGM